MELLKQNKRYLHVINRNKQHCVDDDDDDDDGSGGYGDEYSVDCDDNEDTL